MDLGKLFIAAVGGEVVALDRRTGRERWRTCVDPAGGALTLALEDDRRVLAASGTHLACLGYESGWLLWIAPLGVRSRGRTALLVDEGGATVGRRGVLERFDRDGARRWARRIETTGDIDLPGAPAAGAP